MQTNNTSENDISGTMPSPSNDQTALLLRKTSHEADVHFSGLWESDFNEKKTGVNSERKYSYIFSDELVWEESHHRWSSDKVEDTDMWEIDLSSLFYVACVFMQEDAEVTIDEEVWDEYVALTDS